MSLLLDCQRKSAANKNNTTGCKRAANSKLKDNQPDVLVFVRVVNEDSDFLGPDLGGPESEDEEHRVDDVALAAAVRAHDGGEAFVERAQNLIIK